MRIIVAGPPKTGNVWIKALLARTYQLTILSPPDIPRNIYELALWVAEDRFPPDSIFHQHFYPSEILFATCSQVRCHLVTILRNPYDTFVSLYHYIQRFSESYLEADDPGSKLIGKPIDHPDVLSYLEQDFRKNLQNAAAWLASGKTSLVWYERLHSDTLGEFRRLTARIRPVEDAVLTAAVGACTSEAMKKENELMAKHIRSAKVGDWRDHLGPAHLNIFRTAHSALIRRLGYQVV